MHEPTKLILRCIQDISVKIKKRNTWALKVVRRCEIYN